MNELSYLLYILSFLIGSVLGLLLSYKKHGESFIVNEIDVLALIISIVGWILIFNNSLFTFIFPLKEITIAIALLLISFVFGMRPGYGRYETVIGIVISAVIWGVTYLII